MILLVTGATAGFGLSIARRFAAEGARVIAAGRAHYARRALSATERAHLGARDDHTLPGEAVLPEGASGSVEAGIAQLPPALHDAFSTAMAQSLLLPAAVLLVGIAAVLGFALPRHLARGPAPERVSGAGSPRT